MIDKMHRFLDSINITNHDDFDLDFELVSRNPSNKNQVEMIIVKNSPWSTEQIEQFQDALQNINYAYLMRFSYSVPITAQNALDLFSDWHRRTYRFKSELNTVISNNKLLFLYNTLEQQQLNESVIKDFKSFLKFLCYPTIVLSLTQSEYEKATHSKENEQKEMKQIESDAVDSLKEQVAEAKKLKEERIARRNSPFMDQSWRDRAGYRKVTKFSQLNEDSGNVELYGQIFVSEKAKTTKTGKGLISFGIGTPDLETINCKAMENDFVSKDFIVNIEKSGNGKWAKICGWVEKDKFSGKYVVNCRHIEYADEPPLRVDNAEQKRVELHLHTKMSNMDGASTFDRYCKIAKNMGHTAIALTDHGVTQSYPDAQNKDNNLGLKVLYGIELYMVNDEFPFGLNPCDKKLTQASYVVFDLETTGLSLKYDKITEFGAVKFEKGNVVDSLDFFVDPQRPIPLVIQTKTHITQDMVDGQPTIEEQIDRIIEFFGDSIIVSHNIQFDVGFLNEALRRMGREPIKNSAIDTLSLSRLMFPNSKNHKLGTLSSNLDLDTYDEEKAHRANEDAESLTHVWVAMLNLLIKEKGNNLTHRQLCNFNVTKEMLQHVRSTHVTALAKTQEGISHINELVSLSHQNYFTDSQPKTPRREISRLREGLLLGTACFNGEIFDIARTRTKEDLLNALKFYDYVEIQPLENYVFLVNIHTVNSLEDIKVILNDIIEAAEELGLPVVATGDVHYADPSDKIVRDVIISALAKGNRPHPLSLRDKSIPNPDQHYRSTEEMLKCFEFLGKEKAFEYVVTNTNKIANLIEDIKPIQSDLHAPVIENAPEVLRETCYKNAKEIYGDPLPKVIEERLEKELAGIINNGYSVTYSIANKLVKYANDNGYIVGSRGSVGSSFAAHMFGITEVNPLAPHYICPKCKHFEFSEDPTILSGFDLPTKKCPVCGEKMDSDGQNIPFETFLGFKADKIPDIDLNFPSDFQQQAFDYTKTVFGEYNVFKAGTIETVADKTAFGHVRGYFERQYGEDYLKNLPGSVIAYIASRVQGVKNTTGQHPGGIMVLPKGLSIYDFTPTQYPGDNSDSTWLTTHLDYNALHAALLKLDLLGHKDPMAIRMMTDMTGIKVDDIPLNDKKVISLFYSPKMLHLNGDYLKADTGATGLPEFGTDIGQGILLDAKPTCFADLVTIAGLAHGTDVWNHNQRDLVVNGTCTLHQVIGCRDDIMTYLISKGVPSDIAFKTMEDVRKGKKVKPEYDVILRENKVPDWYINACNRIQYMFPKGHAVAYCTMAVRVGYFKLYYPLEFYAVWFSIRCKAYDIDAMLGGKDSIIARYEDIKRKESSKIDKPTPKEKDIFKMLIVAIEMYERGYSFSNVDLYRSKATEFVVDKETNSIIPPFIVFDGLGEAAAQSVVDARKNGEFLSQQDLLNRTGLSKTNVADLKRVGVLKGLNETNQMSLFDF